MPVPIPTDVPRWSETVGGVTTGTVDPPSAKKDSGFVSGEHPPAQFVNWLFNLIYLWILYLQDLANQAWTWTNTHVFQRGVTISPVDTEAAITVGNLSTLYKLIVKLPGYTPSAGVSSFFNRIYIDAFGVLHFTANAAYDAGSGNWIADDATHPSSDLTISAGDQVQWYKAAGAAPWNGWDYSTTRQQGTTGNRTVAELETNNTFTGNNQFNGSNTFNDVTPDVARLATTLAYNDRLLMFSSILNTASGQTVRMYASSGGTNIGQGFEWTINARWDHAGQLWHFDQAGAGHDAFRLYFTSAGVYVNRYLGTAADGWSDFNFTQTNQATVIDSIATLSGLGSNDNAKRTQSAPALLMWGSAGFSNTIDKYLAPGFDSSTNTPATNAIEFRVPFSGLLHNFYTQVHTASDVNTAIKVYKNGTLELTVNLAGGATQASDTASSFSVAAGDRISVSVAANVAITTPCTNFLFTASLTDE